MSFPISHDPTMFTKLVDSYSFSSWYTSLQRRCLSLGVWDFVDPDHTATPMVEPMIPLMPQISDYAMKGAASLLSINGRVLHNQTIVAQPLVSLRTATLTPETLPQAIFIDDLSEIGLKAYESDIEVYKLTLEDYKIRSKIYWKERANFYEVTVFFEISMTTHLYNTCCMSHQSFREWVTNLMTRMDTTPAKERDIARTWYRDALQSPKTINPRDNFLSEYDEAPSTAKVTRLGGFFEPEGMSESFPNSVEKVTQCRADNFEQSQVYQSDMNPKNMIDRLHGKTSDGYPTKRTRHRGAFQSGREEPSHNRPSSTASDGYSPGSNENDVSQAVGSVPSYLRNESPRKGRKNQQRRRQSSGKQGSYKRPRRESVHTDGTRCPACKGNHSLSKCFYINKDQAPEWFRPCRQMQQLINRLLGLDVDLQAQVRALRRT